MRLRSRVALATPSSVNGLPLARGQGDGAEWRVTLRLAGKGAGRDVALSGLRGATRVKDVLRQGAEALGAGTQAVVVVRCEGRVLRGDETLEEAGAGAAGVVELVVEVGVAGGMPGAEAASIRALAEQAGEAACGSDEELAGALGQLARAASGIEGALTRLEAVRLENEGAGPDSAPWAAQAARAAAVGDSREPKVRSAADAVNVYARREYGNLL